MTDGAEPAAGPQQPSLASRLWATPDDAEWALLFLGEPARLLAGRMSEVTLCGTSWLRVETPDGRDGRVIVRIVAPATVREISPCSEADALRVIALQPRAGAAIPPAAPGREGDDHVDA